MPGPIVLGQTQNGWTATCRWKGCTAELVGGGYERAARLAAEHMRTAHPETIHRRHSAWLAATLSSDELYAVACDVCGLRTSCTLTFAEAKELAREHDERGNAELIASDAPGQLLVEKEIDAHGSRPVAPRRSASCDRRLCRLIEPGHCMDQAGAELVGATPWGWRSAIVTAIDEDGTVEFAYDDGTLVRAWHHRDLIGRDLLGRRVAVHEEHRALRIRGAWFGVRIDAGAGPVRAPADPARWAGLVTSSAVDPLTGQAIPRRYRSAGGGPARRGRRPGHG